MAKDFDSMYQALLERESIFSGSTFDGFNLNDDDDEYEFIKDSEDIAKEREEREKKDSKYEPIYGDGLIEENVDFHIYTERHEHKYTEQELAAMRSQCHGAIVNDYGENDIYHISDEERARNDMLAELSIKLSNLKRTYPNPKQYVEAMRTVVEAWELLAKKNYIHDEKEFFKMVSQGTIVSGRIIMPKLKGMSKYNVDLLIKYISNPSLDPSDLVKDNTTIDDDWYDQFNNTWTCRDCPIEYQVEIDESQLLDHIKEHHPELMEEFEETKVPMTNTWGEAMVDPATNEPLYEMSEDFKEKHFRSKEERNLYLLLSEKDIEASQGNIDIEDMEVRAIKNKDVRGYDRRDIFKKKKNKKISKNKRYSQESLHDMLNRIQPHVEYAADWTRSSILTESIFETPKPPKDPFDNVYYDGSWLDEDSLFIYDLVTEEELLSQHPAGERFATYADKEMNAFFETLTKHDIADLELRRLLNSSDVDDTISKNESNRVKKENKKKESMILQRITKLNGNPKFKKLVSKAEEALNKPDTKDDD